METGEYSECYVMYNENEQTFYTCETIDKDRLEEKGHVTYKLFSFYKADGKILGIKEIAYKIFKENV